MGRQPERKLKPDAIPTLFPHTRTPQKILSFENRLERNKRKKVSFFLVSEYAPRSR